ncbi:MAG: HD domain-containing protein [Bdellovibrionaceae bacterium]|nr:HD domain-containing protein [Pseudobdellovibrionaceae bacterium]
MNFLPIRVSTLRGDVPIDFNAYIKINDRYILYLRQGDSFEGPRLKRLREKKLKKMFIIPDEEANYRTYLSRNISMAFDPLSGKPLEVRCEIVQGIKESAAEAVFENPESPEHYQKAKEDSERFAQFLAAEARAAGIILQIENIDRSIAHHGVTVATLATAAAQKIGKFDKRAIQILVLASLLHDIEHFHSAIEIARPLAQFSEDEMKYYRSHPAEGARKLQALKHMDTQVVKIIAQHEEYIDGGGFPNGLKESQMEPLAIYVAAANALDRMVAFEGVPRAEAAKKYMINALGRYPLEIMKTMTEILPK